MLVVEKILIPTAVGRRAHEGFFGCEKNNVLSRVYLVFETQPEPFLPTHAEPLTRSAAGCGACRGC
ncbi:MAG: hypothetical protein ABEK75_04820, partial [Salinibacter sp.]